jgi:hypothetical protein
MVQHATPRKPEVLRIATILGIEPQHAFGLCVIAWMWFDEQTEDGRAIGATELMLDAVVCRAGFSDALRQVGWLQVRDGALQLPNFDRLMGESAKKRAKNSKRQANLRRASVTDLSRTKRDKSATKEEKRREEKNTPPSSPENSLPELPAVIDTPEFRERLGQWLKYKGPKAYKPEGITAMVSRAASLASEHGTLAVCSAMERAMANGWKGWDQTNAFETPKGTKPPPKPPPPNAPVPKRITPVKFT